MFDTKLTWEVVVAFLGMVPLLGGVLGALISALMDLVKAIFHAFDKELPDEWAGRIVLGLNALTFVVVYFVAGVNPVDYVIPGEVETMLHTIVSLISAVIALMVAIPGSKLMHWLNKMLAPTMVSATARNAPKVVNGKASLPVNLP